MFHSNEDILEDIDSTLDQLTINAEALKEAKMNHFFTHEVKALEKTQESLLARLMHRQSLLVPDKKKKMLDSIKKESILKKIADDSKSLAREIQRRQKRAKWRKASSKS